MNLVQKGSQTAKNGFKNEQDICDKFNNWLNDVDAQNWLKIMDYNLSEVESVKAFVLHGFKSDVNVQIQVKLKTAIDTENIQVKLVSNKKGFNQVDKRWLSHYKNMWSISTDVFKLLQYFTGEIKPYRNDVKDSRRMFLNELSSREQKIILDWFNKNKMLILTDIIRGRGKFSAEWILVAKKIEDNVNWCLVNINLALQYYSCGEVRISPKGSLYIGNVTMQRKGDDGGRETANMLQFKLDPTQLFDL